MRSSWIFIVAASSISIETLAVATKAATRVKLDEFGHILDILVSPWKPAESHATEMPLPRVKKFLWCHPNWATPPPAAAPLLRRCFFNFL
jgi:hypothetical protein